MRIVLWTRVESYIPISVTHLIHDVTQNSWVYLANIVLKLPQGNGHASLTLQP